MSTTKTFVPPSFASIGKGVKDLFKKQYDFDRSIKTIRKTRDGVTFEAGSVFNQAGEGRGYLKGEYKAAKYSAEGQFHTDANQESKLSAKFPKLARGVVVTVSSVSKDGDFKGAKTSPYTARCPLPIGSVETTYTQDHFTTTAVVKSNLASHKAKVSAVTGFDGFSVGAQVNVDATSGAALTDYNGALEYTTGPWTASVFTENRLEFVNLSVLHKQPGQTIGATVKSDLHGQNPSATIGTEYALNSTTLVKGKVSLPSNTVGLAAEHRLFNPQLAIGVAAEFKPAQFTQAVKAQNFGISLTFGDY